VPRIQDLGLPDRVNWPKRAYTAFREQQLGHATAGIR
jgi:hypothetical protein